VTMDSRPAHGCGESTGERLSRGLHGDERRISLRRVGSCSGRRAMPFRSGSRKKADDGYSVSFNLIFVDGVMVFWNQRVRPPVSGGTE